MNRTVVEQETEGGWRRTRDNTNSIYWLPITWLCHSCERTCWKSRDCFVITFIAMTQSAFSGHCERFEKSRGNPKTLLLDFFNRPESRNPGFPILYNVKFFRQFLTIIGIRRSEEQEIRRSGKKENWGKKYSIWAPFLAPFSALITRFRYLIF